MSLPSQSQANALLAYWFGAGTDALIVADQQKALWWKSTPALDEDMRTRFGALVERAATGELNDWRTAPRGLLALILLADQLPRNIYRNTARAFAFDAMAREHCRHGLAQGFEQRLRPIERVFHYLPLEHSESLQDQHDSCALFSRLAAAADAGQVELFAGYLRFAERHRDIIARFGRFPHRNGILGRDSTAEELAFLQTPGSSF